MVDFYIRLKFHGMARVFFLLILPFYPISCVSSPTLVNPIYTARMTSTVSGEISLGAVNYLSPNNSGQRSLGAIELGIPISSFCRQALEIELSQYGLRINDNSRLEIDATILKAETNWRKQGSTGSFSTFFY